MTGATSTNQESSTAPAGARKKYGYIVPTLLFDVTPAETGEAAVASVAEEAQGVRMAAPVVAAASVEEAPSEESPTEEVAPVAADELSQVSKPPETVFETLPPEVLTKLNTGLEYVEGIGPVYTQTLKGIGIVTLLDLLKQGAMPKGRAEIADKSGISHKLILKWVNHIDLYRVKGVGSEYADLLEAAGVDTVVELATRNPGNLFERLSAVNEEKHLVRRPPASSQVEEWVEQAKQLPRVIKY
jgi:predicted flap endonuclease-1-like 5' DNA nuclease